MGEQGAEGGPCWLTKQLKKLQKQLLKIIGKESVEMQMKKLYILVGVLALQGCATYNEGSQLPHGCLFARRIGKPSLYCCDSLDFCVGVDTDTVYLQPHLAGVAWESRSEVLMRMSLLKVSYHYHLRPDWRSGRLNHEKCSGSGGRRSAYWVDDGHLRMSAPVKFGNEQLEGAGRVIYSGVDASLHACVTVTKNDTGLVSVFEEQNGVFHLGGSVKTDLTNVIFTFLEDGWLYGVENTDPMDYGNVMRNIRLFKISLRTMEFVKCSNEEKREV